jgi:hypothetical protein
MLNYAKRRISYGTKSYVGHLHYSTEQILTAFQQGHYANAAQLLQKFNQPKYSLHLLNELLNNVACLPVAMLEAILANPLLKISLSPNHLLKIGNDGELDICLKILKDPDLNVRLCRPSILNWAQRFPSLAWRVASSPDILKGLSVKHLTNFIQDYPQMTTLFFSTLTEMAHSPHVGKWERLWAQQSLNQLIGSNRYFQQFLLNTPDVLNQVLSYSANAQLLLYNNPQCLAYIQPSHLKEIFATSRRLALDIAKSPKLLNKINVDIEKLCHHSLFSIKDYAYLVNYYFKELKDLPTAKALLAHIFILGDAKASLYLANIFLYEKNYPTVWKWLHFAYQVLGADKTQHFSEKFLAHLALKAPEQLTHYEAAITNLSLATKHKSSLEPLDPLFQLRRLAAYNLISQACPSANRYASYTNRVHFKYHDLKPSHSTSSLNHTQLDQNMQDIMALRHLKLN